jgi:hypothetical protein
MAKKKPPKGIRSTRKLRGPAKRGTLGALAVVGDPQENSRDRIEALRSLPRQAYNSAEGLEAMMNVLRDKTEPMKVRLAALESLGAAAFSSAAFASSRGDYIATLREVATDSDMELRQRVLGILAREKDGFAQKRLLDGLKDPAKALLPPEKALQLLSYDVHADAYPVAREIVRNPPNDLARREALRLLAADAKSAPMFESLVRDKTESEEIRKLAATALKTLNPAKFQTEAREIVMDKAESQEMQETFLTALTHFGGPEIAKDRSLLERVNSMSGSRGLTLQDAAHQFINKYGK